MPGIFEFLAKKENINQNIANDFILKLFSTEPSKLNAELFFFLKDANEESIEKLNTLIALIRYNALSPVKENERLKNKFNLLFELQKVGFNSIQEQLKDKEIGNFKKIEFDTFFNFFKKQENVIPLHELAKDWTEDNLSENINLIKIGILNQQKLDAEQLGDLGNEQPDDLDFLGKGRIFKEEEKEESFWDRYGKSIIASTVAGAMAGASGGAIAGGVISALSAPVTGGLSLLGVPFLVGVGAAIGFGIGAISGLLTEIALSVYDYHKTKRNPQTRQKEANEFLADPEGLLEPENEITKKNAGSYGQITELSANGDQRLIDSLREKQAEQPQSIPPTEHGKTEGFERDISGSFSTNLTDKNKMEEDDSEENSYNRDRSISF